MNVKSLRRPLIAGTLVCLSTSLSLMAQTAPTSSFYEPELNSIILETAVANTGYNGPGGVPAALVAAVAAGYQLRSRIDTYDPVARTYVGTLFLAAPGEPSPAPAADFTGANIVVVSQSTFRVESIYHVPGSPLSIGMAGRFLGPTAAGACSTCNIVPPGTPFLLSFSYPADAVGTKGDQNAAFAEISFLIPGALNLYSQTGTGSVIVTPAPVPAPTPANGSTNRRTN